MSLNGSVAYSSSDQFGIQQVFRIPSNSAGTPSGIIMPVDGSGVPRKCRLYCVIGMLTNTYPIYLKLFDLATAPVVGTSIPKLTLPLTSNTVYNGSAVVAAPQSFIFQFSDVGVSFMNGIGYSITKNPADNDSTAILAGDVTGLNILWQ